MAWPAVLLLQQPPDVHVDHGGRTTKVGLGALKVAYDDGNSLRELTAILDVIDRHRERLLEAWREQSDD